MPETIHVEIGERWWVLRHLNPQFVDVQLAQLNEQRAVSDKEALVYFIPHQFAKEAVYKKEHDRAYNNMVKVNNDLRSTLHYYLFIKATESDINALVGGDWNRALRLRLTMCRSKSGEPLWATAKDMDGLIALMTEHREMFNIEPSPDGFQVNDKVMLKAKVFRGYEFYVTKVRKNEQGASLTLELPIFNGRFILKTKSVDVAKQHLPMKIQELLSPEYVKRVEQALVGIASQRYGRWKAEDSGQQVETDSTILHDLQFLSYMEFDDSAVHNHVKTLLLLHAVLRKDRHAIARYVPVVQQMLSHPTEAMTDEDAFMMAVLYLATHDANYRDAAKQYEQQHKPLSSLLSQLMRVVKNIRFRSTAKQRISKKTEMRVAKQIEETMKQIRDCDVSSLSPEGVQAVCNILALSPYDTEEGHALQAKMKAALRSQHFPEVQEPGSVKVTQHGFSQARNNLLRAVHPSAAILVAYYDMLVALHPDRSAADSADLYREYLKILLNAYSKAQQFSTSWWQLKAILESYYHAYRDDACHCDVQAAGRIVELK